MLKTELHTHCSVDPRDNKWVKYSAKELVDEALKKKFDVLAITCHNYVHQDGNLKKYAKDKGLLLIFGMERDVEGKHTLMYNISQEDAMKIKNFKDLKEAREKNKGLFTIAAHPMFLAPSCLGKKIYEFPDLFDAWEYSFFHTYGLNLNKKMVRKSKKFKKPVVGNSDVHVLKDLGRTYTLIDAEPNEEAIFEAIKKNKVKVVTRPLPIMEFLHITFKAIFSTIYHLLKKRNES